MFRRPASRKLLSSLAAILILAAGCSDGGLTAVELTPSSVAAARGGLKAKAAKTDTYTAELAVQRITPAGGTLDFGIGRLDFPRGAVKRAVVITARTDGATLSVDFGPDGLAFNPRALPTLTFDLAGYDGALEGLQIVHVDAAGIVLEGVTSFTDARGGHISGQVRHFSAYTVATP